MAAAISSTDERNHRHTTAHRQENAQSEYGDQGKDSNDRCSDSTDREKQDAIGFLGRKHIDAMGFT